MNSSQHSRSEPITPELIVEGLPHLPSAPKVLPRLKRLLMDPNASLPEIVQLIRLDPSLALRVLQVGNTFHFSRGERCLSVEDAVRRVGFDHVYEMVAQAVAAQVLVRPLDVYGLESEALWQRSVATALAAEIVAELCHEERAAAYTAGLLHAIGMVAVDEWALRHRRELRLTWMDSLHEYTQSEWRQLGCTQAEVGAALLQSWDFAEEIWVPVRWQYAPTATAVQPRLAAVVCAAKWLWSLELGPAARLVQPPAEVFRLLRLSPERVRENVSALRLRLRTVSELIAVSAPGRAA